MVVNFERKKSLGRYETVLRFLLPMNLNAKLAIIMTKHEPILRARKLKMNDPKISSM